MDKMDKMDRDSVELESTDDLKCEATDWTKVAAFCAVAFLVLTFAAGLVSAIVARDWTAARWLALATVVAVGMFFGVKWIGE